MKKILSAILLSFIAWTFAAGQVDTAGVRALNELLTLQVDTSTSIFRWQLDRHFDKLVRVPVDTSLAGFQIQDPAFQKYTSLATLGNYSQPSQSLLFTERDLERENIFVNNYYPYMKLYWDTKYTNTHTPFTYLTYINGGSSQNKEEVLDAVHTQNITSILNMGLHLTTARSLGQYLFQRTRNNSVKVFGSYSGNIYTSYFNFNVNSIVADENGGVLKDSYITDTTYSFTKDIPVLFDGIDNPPKHEPDVYNEIRNFSLFTKQELSLAKRQVSSDSLAANRKKTGILYPKVEYLFSLDRYRRLFHDQHPAVGLDSGLYSKILINEDVTNDSMYYWKMSNTLRLQFQGRQDNHYFIDYAYDLTHYTLIIPSANPAADTLLEHWFISQDIKLPGINYNNRLYNSYVSSGFSRVFANHLELDVFGRLYLSGYRQGDFNLSGNIRLFTGKTGALNELDISGNNELRTPDFLMTHYASNNFIWTKNFRKTLLNHLSIKLNVSSKNFELTGDYYLIRDLIFLNEEALPEQYHGNLSVMVFFLKKDFSFWKVKSSNRVAYQTVSNESVLSLPKLVLNSSTYLEHMFNFTSTGGKLLTMIGFDLHYNTKYYADAYMPPLSSFYQQRRKMLGNYPYLDVFLNVQLKKVRFFIEFEHVNTGWLDKNYFTVLHYPMNERNLKFGLSWTFYD